MVQYNTPQSIPRMHTYKQAAPLLGIARVLNPRLFAICMLNDIDMRIFGMHVRSDADKTIAVTFVISIVL